MKTLIVNFHFSVCNDCTTPIFIFLDPLVTGSSITIYKLYYSAIIQNQNPHFAITNIACMEQSELYTKYMAAG